MLCKLLIGSQVSREKNQRNIKRSCYGSHNK